MATYLVTGGAGFIGSHIAARLLRDGHQVRVLDNLFSGTQANLDYLLGLNGDFTFYQQTITDADGIAPLFADVDIVFHQAALVSVPQSIAQPEQTHAICATGTLNVLRAAHQHGVKRVVYAGSSAAYGNVPQPARETSAPLPLSPYGAAKLAAEHYCTAFWHSYGLETVVLRYFNVFGERQDPRSAYAAVIPRFIERMLRGEQPTLYGNGEQTRDFIYIANVVHGNLLAAHTPDIAGEMFNMATGHPITLLTLIDMLNEALGTDITPIHAPARDGDIVDSCADIRKAQQRLGYAPLVSLMDGLHATLADYRATLTK